MMFLRFPGGLRKALTFSYDDGVEQDIELMRILDEHALKATFNISSGLFTPEGQTWPEGTIHRRMTLEAARELYTGTAHEIAVHCLTHASLTELSPAQVTQEVLTDRMNLETLFGGIIRGMAYPFGSYNDAVVDCLRACGILYARTVRSSHDFALPQDWLRLPATCHHGDPELMPLADRFLADSACFNSKLFYLWGHSYEFEAAQNWDVIRAFADRLAGREDIWYATNMEICAYTLAWKQVYASADGALLHNPTQTAFWFEKDGRTHTLAPGETLRV